jgi:MFS transporter, DHA1 family, multidrug resistance protein
VTTAFSLAGVVGIVAGAIMIMAAWGLVAPNSLALAMQRYPQSAGAAAAVVGLLQFTVAAIAAPLPGLAGPANAFPMAVLAVCFPAAAITAVLALSVVHLTEPLRAGLPARPRARRRCTEQS